MKETKTFNTITLLKYLSTDYLMVDESGYPVDDYDTPLDDNDIIGKAVDIDVFAMLPEMTEETFFPKKISEFLSFVTGVKDINNEDLDDIHENTDSILEEITKNSENDKLRELLEDYRIASNIADHRDNRQISLYNGNSEFASNLREIRFNSGALEDEELNIINTFGKEFIKKYGKEISITVEKDKLPSFERHSENTPFPEYTP